MINHERLGQSAEEIAQGFDHISIAQVHGALAYFFENCDFVWQCIRDDEALAEKLRGQNKHRSRNYFRKSKIITRHVSEG